MAGPRAARRRGAGAPLRDPDPAASPAAPGSDLEAYFFAALEHSPEERQAFLDRALGDRPELRAEVESLLAVADRPPGELTAAVEGLLGSVARALENEREEPALADRRIGPYRLVREIGRGGLATVYLAERVDPEFHQQVALKLIRRGLDTEDVLWRLRQERQILAQLEHPYIARLLDGGSTPDGLPYFVLEHIEGEPIDSYCDRRELGLEGRLRLFLKVCTAVAHAHRSLVVHRDLKPSNLLVTPDGTPKLLDFGIAKVLDPRLHPHTALLTAPDTFLLTPEYASPEQVRGLPVTTATDVYSLGVLLYRLLSGQLPYRFASRELRHVEAVITSTEPPPPSAVRAREGAARLARRLQGDLDRITATALAKTPDLRYGSVEQLALDLERYLEGRPVLARGPTVPYRLAKFVRRHKSGLAAALALTTAAGLSLAVHQRRLSDERNRARLEAAKAAQVADFLVELFAVTESRQGQGSQVTARTLLDRGAARIDRELGAQPLVQAALLEAMGRAYKHLGLYDEAEELLGKALSRRRHGLGPDHPEVAATLLGLAEVHQERGHPQGARPLLERALTIQRLQLGPDHPATAETLNDLAAVHRTLGEPGRAEELMREALALRQTRLGPDHPAVAQSQRNLATLLQDQGQLAAAEELYRTALDAERRLRPQGAELTVTLNNLASLLQTRGDYPQAQALYEEALARERRVLEPDHPRLVWILTNLGSLAAARGEHDRALGLLREALGLERARGGEGNREVTAGLLLNLADLLSLSLDRPRAAEPLYREALELRRVVFPPGHWKLAYPLERLGSLLSELGQPARAQPLLEESLAIREALYPPGHWQRAAAQAALGVALAAQGQEDEAAALLAASLPILEQELGSDDPRVRAARRWAPGPSAPASSRPLRAPPAPPRNRPRSPDRDGGAPSPPPPGRSHPGDRRSSGAPPPGRRRPPPPTAARWGG
jgi:serine/threonine-protein kinase